MTLVLILFIAGVLLLAADIFVASFVMAGVGAVAMLAGCIVAYQHFGILASAGAGTLALVLLGVTIYLELFLLPKTRLGRGLVVESTSGSKGHPLVGTDLIGKQGTADTTLAPSGYVVVGGRRFEAFSRSGLVAKGEALQVVGVDNFRLVVSKP